MRQKRSMAPIVALGAKRRRRAREGDHEIVPSDFTSKPRAISSCERTARVGNIRSMIILT